MCWLPDSVSGCADALIRNFKTYPAPEANFNLSIPDTCGPHVIHFDNLSVSNLVGNNSQMNYYWDFGNGQASTDTAPTITFTNRGVVDSTYVITLITTNAYGCSDTMVKPLTIYPDAKADASAYPITGCAPFVIDTNNFNYVDHSVANAWYQWQIMDAQTDSILVSYNRYDSLYYKIENPGDSVYLRMIAYSTYGCNNDTNIVLFHTSGDEPLGISASPSSGCHPLVVQFTDSGPGLL
ncbi:MAG: PKD domain-containing protein [Owenweeksia sp.]|nr:PKD domain-containing protein [Owenweeksia sp.]